LDTTVNGGGSRISPVLKVWRPNVIGAHAPGVLWLVTATSNGTGVPAGPDGSSLGMLTVGGCDRQVSWSTSAAVSAWVANAMLSIVPLNRRSEPSLPISSGPAPI